MIDRIRTVSWYAFAFLLPWQTVWIVREVFVSGEKWQYATLGIYVSDVALLLCAVFFVFGARREVWRVVVRDRVLLLLGVFFLWALLSSLWSIDASLALISAWRIFLMTLAFVLARYGDVSMWKTISIFLLSMSIQASLALSQWAGQYIAPSTLLGIAEHDPSRWGTFVLKTEDGRFLRAYGGFEHPNVLGGALAVAMLFGVWLSVTAKRVSSRAVFLGMTALMSFALVFTFSRSGWMGLLLGMGVLLLGLTRCLKHSLFSSFPRLPCLPAGRRGNDGMGWVSSVVIVILSFSIAFFLVCDIALSRFSEGTLAREGSLSGRALYFEQALSVIREHLVLGVGGGNFTAFTRERLPSAGTFVGAFQPVHMVPVLVFAELGAVGFVLFALPLLCWFVSAWKRRNALSMAIFCTLLPMLLLDHWLWSGHFGMMFLGLLLGVCTRMDARVGSVWRI